jgi:hypothetical protein
LQGLELDEEFAQVHDELFGITRDDFLCQRFETWIAPQRIKQRIHFYTRDKRLFVSITLLEPIDGLGFITKPKVIYCQKESWPVMPGCRSFANATEFKLL